MKRRFASADDWLTSCAAVAVTFVAWPDPGAVEIGRQDACGGIEHDREVHPLVLGDRPRSPSRPRASPATTTARGSPAACHGRRTAWWTRLWPKSKIGPDAPVGRYSQPVTLIVSSPVRALPGKLDVAAVAGQLQRAAEPGVLDERAAAAAQRRVEAGSSTSPRRCRSARSGQRGRSRRSRRGTGRRLAQPRTREERPRGRSARPPRGRATLSFSCWITPASRADCSARLIR